jgi:hypothetical protein
MIRPSAVIALLVSVSAACAQKQPANTTSPPPPSETTTQPTGAMMGGPGTMGGQGMGAQGPMGPGMMDGGSMMGGHGMMGHDMMGMGDHCPMALPGTAVQAQDTKDGMAMTFTSTGDASELRRRVRIMADHINAHSSGSSGGMGMHGMMMGADAGAGGMHGMMPATHAQVEDVDQGARLNMTPVDSAKLGDLRAHMKQHAQMMNESHSCSMMADAGR